MPWYPGAVKRPVTRYQSGSLHVRSAGMRRLVFHTAVSDASSMFSFFNVSGRATPHFYVDDRGNLEQYIDTDYCGTANLNGNHDSICVESWDKGGHVTNWTLPQIETLARLAAWVNKTHGIPLVRLPSSKPGTSGIGWHRLGIDGNFPQPPGHVLGGRVAGGEVWTYSPGKECPFDGKILGTVNQIIPRAKEVAGSPNATPTPEVDELTPEDRDFIKAQFDDLQRRLSASRTADKDRDQKVIGKIAALKKAVAKLPKSAASKQEVQDLLESLDVEFKVVVGDDGTPATAESRPHEESN